jgi:hypothetical protein
VSLAEQYRTALLAGTPDKAPMWTSCTRVRSGKTFTVWRHQFADGSRYDERVSTRAAA